MTELKTDAQWLEESKDHPHILKKILKQRRNCQRPDCMIDHKLTPNELIPQLNAHYLELALSCVPEKKDVGGNAVIGFNTATEREAYNKALIEISNNLKEAMK